MTIERDYRMACEHAVIFDLSQRGKVELAGPDARLFLHNLCTNDVKNLAAGAGCEAFLCTAKARVVAHLLVGYYHAGEEDVVWIDFEPGFADRVYQHLNHYLISERVELTDRTGELGMLRLAGPEAASLLQSYLGIDVSKLASWEHVSCSLPDSGAVIHVRRQAFLSVPGFDLLGDRSAVEKLRNALLACGVGTAGPDAHNVLRLEAGTPVYGVDIDENRLVMEIGRNNQAISYSKGCFLGQEPIVMARDRGHVNRYLVGLKIAEGDPVAASTRLFRGAEEAGQATSSVHSPRLGQVIALAYVRRGSWDPGAHLTIEPESDGRVAEVVALPFISSV